MTECVICPPSSGPVSVGGASCARLQIEVRRAEGAEQSLQLLVSYLSFCSKRNIAADTALEILETFRADLALRDGRSNVAFIEAYFHVADLAFEVGS